MKKLIPFIPLLIIACMMANSIYVVAGSDFMFSYEHYIGLAFVLLAIISVPFSAVVNRAATFLALLLGTFSQAAFTPLIFRYRIGFTIEGRGLDVLVQPYCFILLLVFIMLNWKFVKEMRMRSARY